MMRASLGLMVIVLGACGGDDGGAHHDAAVDTSHVDAPVDSKTFLDAPPGTFPLTVKNYLNWCKVGANNAAEAQLSVQTLNLAPGTYNVSASGGAGFEIQPGMWHHTTGDTGSGETGTWTPANDPTGDSVAMVTIGSAAKCIWVCCEFDTSHAGCSGLAEQCP